MLSRRMIQCCSMSTQANKQLTHSLASYLPCKFVVTRGEKTRSLSPRLLEASCTVLPTGFNLFPRFSSTVAAERIQHGCMIYLKPKFWDMSNWRDDVLHVLFAGESEDLGPRVGFMLKARHPYESVALSFSKANLTRRLSQRSGKQQLSPSRL